MPGDAELATWTARIRLALATGSDVYYYFKHEGEGFGPRLAMRLDALL